jgi:hypothetical protein
VRIDYTLLGKPLSTESNLIEQDGRWYSEDMLQNVRDAHDRLMAPPAPPSSTAAPAAPASAAAPLQTEAKPAASNAAVTKH